MFDADFERFGAHLTAEAELRSKTVSAAAMTLWWETLKCYAFADVQRAFEAHRKSDAGRFLPMPADIVRQIDGTASDKAAIAWGKVYEAMGAVGAYSDVVFDDAAIHAAVDDLGGWPKLCRTELAELGYVQTRFAKSYHAYSGRDGVEYPRMLCGAAGPDNAAMLAKRGLKAPPPAIVGDVEKARQIWRGGSIGGKTQISFTGVYPIAQKLGALENTAS